MKYFLPILMLCVVSCGCMGYRVGTHTLFSKDVETVYVPIFRAEGARRQTAERLTEAVIKRIEAKSRYKVIARPTADSTLEGMIVTQRSGVSLYNEQNLPRQKEVSLVVKVKWTDRRRKDLRQFDEIPWYEAAGSVNNEVSMVPEYGHSQATAEQAVIDAIADKIVGMMETPW